MTRSASSRALTLAVSLCAAAIGPARADQNYLFQVTNSGLVSTLDVTNVGNPASTYQIAGLGASDVVNAASFDPATNRFYYVDNLTASSQAQLDYVQLNAQGVVVGQASLGTLPPQVTFSYGADFYAGHVYISQNGTNQVYGFDPNNLGTPPIALTLPTPSSDPTTLFYLGDLTFNAAAKQMFIAGSLGDAAGNAFIYEYSLNANGDPTLIASRVYAASGSDPRFNGIIFNQDSGLLYGYSQTGHLYTIDTTTLTIATDVGTNPVFYQGGDLAGFSPNPISVPEPASLATLGLGAAGLIGYARNRRKSATA